MVKAELKTDDQPDISPRDFSGMLVKLETVSSRGESAKSHKVIGTESLRKIEISPYRKKKNLIR